VKIGVKCLSANIDKILEAGIVNAGKRGKDIPYRLSGRAPPEPKRTMASLEEFMKKESDHRSELAVY
jgi:hypothetical protein